MTLDRAEYIAVAIFALGGCSVGPIAKYERSVVYQPTPVAHGDWRQPEARGFEDVEIKSRGGVKLHGWYIDPPGRRAVVLFMHGNGGNVAMWSEPVRQLALQHRVAVLLFDYRGYGKSEGEPTEQGVTDDADAARSWLAKRAQVAEESIILMGQSLGGGVAIATANYRKKPRGLVLVSTFTSMPDVAAHHMAWLPAHLVMSQRFPSEKRIKSYDGPLLVCHGDHDRIIPFEQGQALYAAAASENKRFVRFVGRDHLDPLPREFHQAFHEFLATLPPEEPYRGPHKSEMIRYEPERMLPSWLRE
jgi:fermentation-respiration switch protein FrsA (DUF1100 family)